MTMAPSTSVADLPWEQAVARVGLISDTHMPERCRAFPPALFDLFEGVDLILHAGDLGELWVLDELGALAPVVAVHGNDDTPDAQRELPLQQLMAVGGWRILVWHGHYRERAVEMAHRGGPWAPKLARMAERGRRGGAEIVIVGHAHVPMVHRQGDVLLINPGALASGSLFTRQSPRTVALLLLFEEGEPLVAHVDLEAPDAVFAPEIDWEADFDAAMWSFQAPIVEGELLPDIEVLKRQRFEDFEALKRAILPLCQEAWAGNGSVIGRDGLLEAVASGPGITPDDREKALAVLSRNDDGSGLHS